MSQQYTALKGGLDLLSQPNTIDPSRSLVAINYETPDTGGYRSIKGYESLGAPAGEGAVLGLTVWDDTVFAIRSNGTDGELYRYDFENTAWVTCGSGLPIGERYDFTVANFLATDAEVLYFVCKAGKPWKWNGTTLTEITAAQAGASFITSHANHLFIGFREGSVQFSSLGEPDQWDATTGAGEIGVSDRLNGFTKVQGGSLVIGCEDTIQVLYGSGAADFELKELSSGVGVSPYTMQSIGTMPMFKTAKGLTSLQAAQVYGDFQMGDFAKAIAPLFKDKAKPTCSMASKNNNQYRLFFADGTGIYATFVGETLSGITTTSFPHGVELAASGNDSNGGDLNVFADADGNVYRLDQGTSFDGLPINTYLTLAYNHFSNPVLRKRFRRAIFDLVANSAVQISVLPSYDFGNERVPRHRVLFKDTLAQGGLWDFDNWDSFAWGSPLLDMSSMRLTGSGTHVSFVVNTSSTTAKQHTIHGYTTVYEARRISRG